MPQGSNFFKTYKKNPGIANIFLVKKKNLNHMESDPMWPDGSKDNLDNR